MGRQRRVDRRALINARRTAGKYRWISESQGPPGCYRWSAQEISLNYCA
jgi:hypothetical protein